VTRGLPGAVSPATSSNFYLVRGAPPDELRPSVVERRCGCRTRPRRLVGEGRSWETRRRTM